MAPKKMKSDQVLALKDARVLVVEDEYYIADDLRRTLENAGAQVVGPVATLKAAQAALEHGGFDCAVIDLNLHGESAVTIGDQLMKEGKPFVIATGYDTAIVPERLKSNPCIDKPFEQQAVLASLIEQMGRR